MNKRLRSPIFKSRELSIKKLKIVNEHRNFIRWYRRESSHNRPASLYDIKKYKRFLKLSDIVDLQKLLFVDYDSKYFDNIDYNRLFDNGVYLSYDEFIYLKYETEGSTILDTPYFWYFIVTPRKRTIKMNIKWKDYIYREKTDLIHYGSMI